MWWKKRLEDLRQEREPRHEQPTLQLPLPPCEPPPERGRPEDKPERGITVIDFSF